MAIIREVRPNEENFSPAALRSDDLYFGRLRRQPNGDKDRDARLEETERGNLRDTCLTAQDAFRETMKYFRIEC